MAGFLQPIQQRDRDEIANVQAGRRRIISDITRDNAVRRLFIQCVRIGDLMNEATLFENVEDIRLVGGLGLMLSAKCLELEVARL